MRIAPLWMLAGLIGLATPAVAQDATMPPSTAAQAQPAQSGRLRVDITGGIGAPTPIAIPPMPTTAVTNTAAGSTDALGQKLSQVISDDLRNSGLFSPVAPNLLRRPINPADVAATCLFLAQTPSLTGTTVCVDNGQHLVPLPRDIMFVVDELLRTPPAP